MPGASTISSYTQTDSTKAAIDLALLTLDRLHKDGLDAPTVASAKHYIAGQFAPGLETSPQLARTLVELTLDGDTRDTVDGYLRRIDTATPVQIAEARNVFAPSQDQVLVVIGDASKIRDVVKTYGPMTEMEITDPRFTPTR
jgi:zinc protease